MTSAALGLTLMGDQSIPLYQKIKDAIRQKISSHEWQPGLLIPSENQLAEALGVSRMTINRPLRELTAEGLLRRAHGLGTFVADPPRRAHLIKVSSIAEEIQRAGRDHRAQVLTLEAVKGNSRICNRMQLATATDLFKVVVVHFQDDIPIQLEFRYVNPSLVPNFIDVDFSATTPTEYLIGQIRPEELEHVVQAIVPSKFMARHLDIPASEPCLKLSRRTWKNEQVVTSVELVYPSSRYELGDRSTPTHTS
jgi:GntR family histidine utilization transcriptional repressor